MISIPGVGSGIDVDSLVTQLVAAEGNVKTQLLTNRRADVQAQISAFGSLKSALSEFQSSASALSDSSAFRARTASSEDTTIFSVTATQAAEIGSYAIEVVSLAESAKLSSTGFDNSGTVVGTGTLSISVGSATFDVTVDSENNTVEQLKDAINSSSANTGVVATTINVDDGLGGTETRLVLTSEDPGTANAITVTTLDDDGNNTDTAGLSALVYDPDGSGTTNSSLVTAAADAQIRIDGQLATRSSNTMDDVIEDVTINLQAADVGTEYQLTIIEDAPAIVSNVEQFVEDFNALNNTFNQLSSFNPDTNTGSILLGDFTLRGIETQIRRAFSDQVIGLTGQVRDLVDLGITTNENGSLSFDAELLESRLETDAAGVENFFTSDTGFANRLDGVLEGFLTSGGVLDGKTNGLNARIQDIDSDLEDLNLRLQTLEERLLAQFSALDGLLAQLQTTSNFLAQNLAASAPSA